MTYKKILTSSAELTLWFMASITLRLLVMFYLPGSIASISDHGKCLLESVFG